MKLIKMKIQRIESDGKTSYRYPTPYYNAIKVEFGPIYEGGLDAVVQSDIKPRNANYEYILIGVSDVNFNDFMKSNNYTVNGFVFGAEEVDKNNALLLGDKWIGERREKITDATRVIQILAKVARKESLTAEEEKAIDPNDPTPGIVKSKSFEESLNDYLS